MMKKDAAKKIWIKAKKCLVFLVAVTVLSGSLTAGPAFAKTRTPVNVKVGKKTFPGFFYNNATAKALLKRLPKKYKMNELNGNEKYKYLRYDLPAKERKIKRIKAGDIMLYGSDCLVVFYKSFDTTYRYTRVGRITRTTGLKKAAGTGKVVIRFSKRKK